MGNVLDIRSQLCSMLRKNIFVLDTNVLYWTFYPKCTYSQGYQKIYSDKLVLLKRNNTFITLTANIAELFSLIERSEFSLYKDNEKTDDNFTLKDFRQISAERIKLEKMLNLIYNQIKAFTNIRDCMIPASTVEMYAQRFSMHKLDVYDCIMVDFCEKNQIDNIITDDWDFSCALEALNVITANNRYFS